MTDCVGGGGGGGGGGHIYGQVQVLSEPCLELTLWELTLRPFPDACSSSCERGYIACPYCCPQCCPSMYMYLHVPMVILTGILILLPSSTPSNTIASSV